MRSHSPRTGPVEAGPSLPVSVLGVASGSLDLPVALGRLLGATPQRLGVERGFLALVESGRLVLRAALGPMPAGSAHRELPLDARAGDRLLLGGDDVEIGPVTTYTPGSLARLMAGVATGLVTPIGSGPEPIGVLVVGRATARPFSMADRTQLRVLADQAAIAVAQARLTGVVPTCADRLRALVGLARALAAGRRDGTLLSAVVSETRRLLDGRLATLRLLIGSELVLLDWSGEGPVPSRLAADGGPDGLVVAAGRSVRLPEAPPDTRPTGAIGAGPVPAAAYLGVPLGTPERPMGVLAVHSASPRAFTHEDVTLLDGLAALASVALDPGGSTRSRPEFKEPGSLRRAPLTADLAPAPASSVRVLLVEDDQMVGDLMARFLELDGYRVDRTQTGRQGLDRIRTTPYRLVVSDIAMPDLDGRDFYRELGLLDPSLARRTVFVTGDIGNPETSRFLEESGAPCLLKPFGLAEFRALVRGVLTDG